MSDLRFAVSARVACWTTAIVAIILLIHLFTPGMMRISESGWNDILTYHQTLEAFRVRPIVTNLAMGVQEATGFSFKTAFFILQFSLLLAVGPALAFWYRTLGFSKGESVAGIALFLLSLPVAMAFIEPVFTWSDILCYLLVPLALASAVRGRLTLLVVTLIPCILEREINVVLLPVVGVLVVILGNAKLRNAIVACALSLIAVAGIRLLISGASDGSPEAMLAFNFDGFLRSRDSIFSMWVSLGAIWIVGLRGVMREWSSNDRTHLLIARCGLYLTLSYVIASVVLGRARESRLFMPAAFLLIPLTLLLLRDAKESALAALNRYGVYRIIGTAIASLTAGILLSKAIFPDFEYRHWRDGNWIWSGMHIAVIILLSAMWLVNKKRGASAPAE